MPNFKSCESVKQTHTYMPMMYTRMYVVVTCTSSIVQINRQRLAILLVVRWTGKLHFPLFLFAPADLVSQDRFGHPFPRRLLILHTQDESDAYSRDSSPFRDCVYLLCIPPTAINRISLEFTRPRNCVPMTFTVECRHIASSLQSK